MVQLRIGEQLSGTPYRVVEAVGSGGMGSVFEVEHAELGKRFVLKVLHHHLASRPDLVGRMRNEWRALAKLNHPSIVQVTDAGQLSSGLPYYVMEKLEGRNLGQWIAQMGRLSPGQAGAIMSDVLDGLHAAHSTGAIHRDVKPQNIFVLESGRAKLLDFGIAKLKDRAARVVTAGGVSIGTPRYMAPEQAEGMSVDGRADIYAAGLVLYEAIAGKGPFAHIRDPNELVLAHIGIDPIRLDEIVQGISPEWADLVQRWLSKRPADRPASAGMAAVELRALIHATASSEPTAHRDVTLGGVYDAETLGAAEQNAAESQPQALHSSAALPLDNATSGHRARSEDQPRETEVRSTLGWGTSASDFTGTQTMRPDATERGAVSGSTPRTRPSAAHSTGDRTRRKNHAFTREPWASQSAMWTGSLARPQTPAPVSSSPWPHVSWWDRLTPVQKNVVTVLGAAVGSFTIAWLGVHTYSTIQSDLAAQSSSPVQSDTSPSSHSVAQGDSSPRAGLPSAPPFNAPQFNAPQFNAPPPAAAPAELPAQVKSRELAPSKVGAPPQGAVAAQGAASAQAVTVAQPQASAPSKTAVPRAAGPSTSSPKTGAMQKATTPRAPTKPAASKQLPGSGLW